VLRFLPQSKDPYSLGGPYREERIVLYLRMTGVETMPSCTSPDRAHRRTQPRSGERMQPTAQAVGTTV